MCIRDRVSTQSTWGVNGWTTPNAAYQPAGTLASTGGAVETPFTQVDGNWQVVLGPFNNAAQAVSSIKFVIKHSDTNWDNNGGSDYLINISTIATDNPTGKKYSQNARSEFGLYYCCIRFWIQQPDKQHVQRHKSAHTSCSRFTSIQRYFSFGQSTYY
eukprot:TRINITY_DN16633_c0_g1_i1.p1 TRINITY_DN16633_c0_g1~~TRINITY_DN16633_c0_g1_i1.p1  ORF type:complete len:158 (-),score=5.11 TRINITY_DN16633_c0_g1_i1:36-509(-)